MIETPLVYEQIDSFNTRPSNPLQPKSDSIEKQRLFVVKDTAHKSAAFLGFLFKKKTFSRIITRHFLFRWVDSTVTFLS